MDKSKVLKDNHKKKDKILLQKLPAILCKEHLVTMKFCYFTIFFFICLLCYKNPWKEKQLVNLKIKLENWVKIAKN